VPNRDVRVSRELIASRRQAGNEAANARQGLTGDAGSDARNDREVSRKQSAVTGDICPACPAGARPVASGIGKPRCSASG
jgi:hypothetical protein